jgi:hypothetical protein
MIDKKQAANFEIAETADATPKEYDRPWPRALAFMRCVARTTSAGASRVIHGSRSFAVVNTHTHFQTRGNLLLAASANEQYVRLFRFVFAITIYYPTFSFESSCYLHSASSLQLSILLDPRYSSHCGQP